MQFLPLLGKQLKDNDVIDVLEGFEMEVVYDFDRLHEGQPDKYWASSKQAGFQLGFDAGQSLDVCFLHITPSDGLAAFSLRDSDIPLFTTTAEFQSFGESQGLQVSKGRSEFMGVARDWVRLGFATHSVHYEYHGGRLALVTISRHER
jgi:hypothetical protein